MAFSRLHASRPTRLVGAASIVGGAVAVALAILGPASAASAATTDPAATCTPSEAWTENIPAQGDPTIPNPDYVPAVPAHQDGFVKWSWNGSNTDGAPVFDATSSDWQVTSDRQPNAKDDTSGTVYQQGNGRNASWFSWQPFMVPGTPAQGDPTIPNPDYVPASTVDHAAVVCDPATTPAPDPTTPAPDPTTPAPDPTTPAPDPTTPAPDPTTPAPDPTTPAPDPTTPAPDPTTPAPDPTTPAPDPTTPAPDPTTTTPDVVVPTPTPSETSEVLADETATDPTDTAVLAETGSNDVQPLLLAGLGLIAIGGIVLMEARRPRRNRG